MYAMSILSAPVTLPLHAVELGLAKHPAFAGHHHDNPAVAGAPAGPRHVGVQDIVNGNTAPVHTVPASYRT